MQIEVAFNLKDTVKIKANEATGMITGIYLGYQNMGPQYLVEYKINSTNQLTDRYFLADELEAITQ